MSSKKVFFAMLGSILLLVCLCGAGTYFANKMLAAEGKTLYDLKLEQAVLDKQEGALTQAKKDIAEYEELESIARTVVPQEKDQARTTLEILALAKEAGVPIVSVTFPESQLGDIIKKKAEAKTDENGEQTAPAPKPKEVQVDSNTTQLTAVTGIKGLYTMEIQVTTDAEKPVRYAQLLDYLERLENNRRTAQVKNISITPSPENRNLVSFTLTLNSYVRP